MAATKKNNPNRGKTKPSKNREIHYDLTMTDEVRKGSFANQFLMKSTGDTVMIDFLFIDENSEDDENGRTQEGVVQSRVIMPKNVANVLIAHLRSITENDPINDAE